MTENGGNLIDTLPELLCTGVGLTDNEHAYLFYLLGRLEKVCVRDESRCDACDATQIAQCDRPLSVLISEFLHFMSHHFHQEESLMRAIGMPKNLLDQHVEEHANISQRAHALVDSNRNNIVVKPADFQQVIVTWLEDHIKNWDMPIASHLGPRPQAEGSV
jgi:hemerythrin-like metal-binding protein